jgi:hypothetical protein
LSVEAVQVRLGWPFDSFSLMPVGLVGFEVSAVVLMVQPNAAETAASYLWDDNRRAYSGEDYEKVLIRALLALNPGNIPRIGVNGANVTVEDRWAIIAYLRAALFVSIFL